METLCKNCDMELTKNSHSNFCSRKCRTEWIRNHNKKGAKKKYSLRNQANSIKGIFKRYGDSFDYEGNNV